MTRFLIVPQWQGSPAARAMLLVEGAQAIAGDLPRAATTMLDIPLEAGDALGTGVHRLSALQRIRRLVGEHMSEDTVVIGGDCGVTVAALAALPGGVDDLALVWCDAHADLHTPESSPSGAFSGMALRAALGEGEPGLALSPGVDAERVVLVGAREVDDGERETLARIRRVDADALESLPEAVVATGAARMWVHIDVDVLDPAEIAGVTAAAPFGAKVAALSTALRAARERMPLVGASITGFAPRTLADAVEDLGALLRLVGAVA